MASQGSPHARLRRAIASGNATLALAAAAELPHVTLDDALALVILLRDDEDRFDRAVVRWHARFCLEVGGVEPDEAQLTLAALRSLSGPDVAVGVAALAALCERHRLRAAAEALRRIAAG